MIMKLPQDLEFGRESEFWLQELLYPGWWCINGHVGAVIIMSVFEVFKTSTRDVAGTYIYRLWKAHDEY